MSLRQAIFLWMAALIAIMGLATAAAGYWFVRQEAGEFLDDQLRQVALYVGHDSTGPVASSLPYLDPEDHLLIQIWDPAGKPIRISDPKTALERRQQTGFGTAYVDQERWRVYTLVEPSRTIQIAQQWQVRQELAAGSAWRAALPVALLIPLAWLILTLVIDRSMRRLNDLAVAVAARDPDSIEPLNTDDVPAEVLPFARSINGLLERIATVLDRQRRFVSDAAHELRTPLAALQIQVENLKSANHDKALLGPLADMEAGIQRSAGMVGQLLRLARYDAGPGAKAAETIDLAELTLTCLAEIAPLAERKQVDLGVVRQDAARCIGHPGDIAIILANMIDNAIRYTPVEGCIDVSIVAEGNIAAVIVMDTGPGIADAHLTRIFERFYRASSVETEGSGLGLAIAKAAAERNGATLTLTNRIDRSGLICRLELPRSV